MRRSQTDFAVQKQAIAGRFSRDTSYVLEWLPAYVDDFFKVLDRVPQPFEWDHCKFVKAAKTLIPDKWGVYCFSIDLGVPFPEKCHVLLYIGKASDQYLSERFQNYVAEAASLKGREKLVVMLRRYKDKLTFWWVSMPKVYVDVVEQHLLMCCKPPCNTATPDREKFWAKAFD